MPQLVVIVALVIRLVTLALLVIVGLDAVGLAIGCALRRRRGAHLRVDAQSTGVR